MVEEIFICDVCNQEFGDRDSLAGHMVTNHSQKRIEVGEGEEK